MLVMLLGLMMVTGVSADEATDLSCPVLKASISQSLNRELLAPHPLTKLISDRAHLAEIRALILKRYNTIDYDRKIDFDSPDFKKYYAIMMKKQIAEKETKGLEALKLSEEEEVKLSSLEDKPSDLKTSFDDSQLAIKLRNKKIGYYRSLNEIKANQFTKGDLAFLAAFKKKQASYFAEEKRYEDLTAVIDTKLDSILGIGPAEKSVGYISRYNFGDGKLELETKKDFVIRGTHQQTLAPESPNFSEFAALIAASKIKDQLPNEPITGISFNVTMDGEISELKKSVQMIVITAAGRYPVPSDRVSPEDLASTLLPANCPVREGTDKAAIYDSRSNKERPSKGKAPSAGSKAKAQ